MPHATTKLRSRTVRRFAAMSTVFVCVLGLMTVGFPGVAAAHSDVAASSPEDGATVLGPVSEIELVFATVIDFDASSFQVIDDNGEPRSVEHVAVADDGVTMTIFVSPIDQGTVGVGYTIIAGDSHPRSGSLTFAVSAPLWVPETRSCVFDKGILFTWLPVQRPRHRVYFGLYSPLRHVRDKPWSEHCGRIGRGFVVSDRRLVQACDLRFWAVSEGGTRVENLRRRTYAKALVRGGVQREGCRLLMDLLMPATDCVQLGDFEGHTRVCSSGRAWALGTVC